MILGELPGGIVIRQLNTLNERDQYRSEFIDAYQSVFRGAPFLERHYPESVATHLDALTHTSEHLYIIATGPEDQLVGFALGLPANKMPTISSQLSGLIPLRHTFYFAELGVRTPYRRMGIGSALINARLHQIDPLRYNRIALRIPVNYKPIKSLYLSKGFQEMGVWMKVSTMRVDGRVRADRREFLSTIIQPNGSTIE